MTNRQEPPRLTFFLASMQGGGIQIATIRLLRELSRQGILTELVVVQGDGPIRSEVPPTSRLVDLGVHRTRFAFIPLVKYLLQARPQAGVSAQTHLNVLLILLRLLTGYPKKLAVAEHITFTEDNLDHPDIQGRSRLRLIRLFYRFATRFVAVSEQSASSIRRLGNYRGPIEVIPNGLDLLEIARLQQAPPDPLPWDISVHAPVIISVGRLAAQKDYSTLLHALSLLSHSRNATLVILGEGEQRAKLENLAAQLGIAGRVLLPGFIHNPYPLLARAELFVLSSRWEGFANVVMEALACGLPIVTTDCPGGPADLLANQRFARVVPVGDAAAMATAISDLLSTRPPSQSIIDYAQRFDVNLTASRYLRLFEARP